MNYTYSASGNLPQSALYDSSSATFGSVFFFLYCCFILAMIGFSLFAYYTMAKKMGYNPWLGLLMILPFVNLILILLVLFTKWPIEEEVERLRELHKSKQ